MDITKLTPKEVWLQFNEILKVPRPSKHEEKMVEYLVKFAEAHKLEYFVDETQNVLIRKSASKGMEGKPSVALQAHIDMVCDKEVGSKHNFMKDPIKPIIDGEWVKADKTTLGADDGIGVAVMLAILSSDKIQHGPLECLFTVDEETGLTGAFGLQEGVLQSKILLNLDSEDDGQIFIGCAGGIDTVGTFRITYQKTPPNCVAYKMSVGGLLGGHSGDDINKGRGNAIILLNRCIYDYYNENFLNGLFLAIADFSGGNLRNAIARTASATVVVFKEQVAAFENFVQRYNDMYSDELAKSDPNVFLKAEKVSGVPRKVLSYSSFDRLTNLLYTMPHGVMSMSFKLEGIVESSTNLASVNINGQEVVVVTSQRSDSDSLKHFLANKVHACFDNVHALVKHSDGYPGWTPNEDSHILKVAMNVYKKLFNQDALACSIHAGLECGLFLQKYPGMDMISYGPTLRDVHTPQERIHIPTVDKFWKMTLEILKTV